MGWRFRRSFKIAPGIRLDVGKRGFSSLSLGGGGATLNIGKKGVRPTVSLPGTGLSFSSSSSSTNRPIKGADAKVIDQTGTADVNAFLWGTSAKPSAMVAGERFGLHVSVLEASAGRARYVLWGIGAVACALSLFLPQGAIVFGAGVLLFLIGCTQPSRRTLETREGERIQTLARAELARRLELFAAAVAGLTGNATATDIRRVLSLQHELSLTDLEVARYQIEQQQGTADLLEFESGCNGQLPVESGHEQVVSPDLCYFARAAIYDKRGENDPKGTLYLTDARVVFLADVGLTAAPWRKVISVGRDGRTVRIQRRDRETPYLFDCPTYGDAMKAEYIAKHLLAGGSA